jgi:hypothetical protein
VGKLKSRGNEENTEWDKKVKITAFRIDELSRSWPEASVSEA